jgi:hypothetical protein
MRATFTASDSLSTWAASEQELEPLFCGRQPGRPSSQSTPFFLPPIGRPLNISTRFFRADKRALISGFIGRQKTSVHMIAHQEVCIFSTLLFNEIE